MENSEWFYQANCATVDYEIMFPDTTREAKLAKKICSMCVVKEECLEHALDIGEVYHGVYGGKTPKERSEIWKSRQSKK